VRTLTFTSAAITIPGYFSIVNRMAVAGPVVDGYVVGMDAWLIDSTGQEVSYRQVMIHHLVFFNLARRDKVCSQARGGLQPERFYARGEEGFILSSFPAGYGYPVAGPSSWGLVYMLMNHRAQEQTVRVRYVVRYVTGKRLKPVTPLWLDIRQCARDPVWDVPGTGGKGSTNSRSVDIPAPLSGRLVAGTGHLHGGGIDLRLSNTSCHQTLFVSRPTWAHQEPRPLLHEGGPSHMTTFTSSLGIPITAGDDLHLTATYDNSLPHTRVMGIMVVYLVPGKTPHCAPVPPLQLIADKPGPPPLVPMPLPRAPRGPIDHLQSATVQDFRITPEQTTIPRGTLFTWHFQGAVAHNITVVNGPIGFSSPSLPAGNTFSHRFTRPGTYKIVCSLHPVAMVQQITVR